MRRPYKPSPITTEGDVSYIHLNNGGIAVIDTDAIGLVEGLAWRSHPNGSGNVYASCRTAGKTKYLHRVVSDAPKGLMIDHKDGDGLNCRKANLRHATNGQNGMNSRSRKAGYKGVFKHHDRELWYASLGFNGKKIKLPYRKTALEAAMDYDAAAREKFGEFANVNLPGMF